MISIKREFLPLTRWARAGWPEGLHPWRQNDGMAAHHCGHRNSAHHRRIS